MKIVNLKISNLMKISAVEIAPDGNVVVISGKNGAGKTSVLNAIAFALGGQKLVPAKPIKEGETSAEVTIGLGKYNITRSWTDNETSKLKVESTEGAVFKSPQKMLDQLIGELSFDPLAFMRMSPKQQRDLLLGLVQLEVNLDELAVARSKIFEERTALGRTLKQKEGELAGINPPEQIEETISIKALLERLRDAQGHNSLLSNLIAEHSRIAIEKESVTKEIETYKQAIVKLETREKELYSKRNNVKKQITSLGEEKEISTIETAISEAEEKNAAIARSIAQKEKAVSLSKEVESVRSLVANATDKIADIDSKKAKALRSAKFPLEGLSISENGLTWKEIPLDQASSAEQLKVSMAIAMELNPKIRVIRITDGSLLDSANMAVIEEMAKNKDFQIWVEVVDESGKVGVVIEDGHIKEIEPSVAPPSEIPF